MIYRGIKIKKIENMNYEFKFGDTIHASRIATVRAIIDGLMSNCKDSTELVSVCEFQLSTKTVFDWGEIRLKLVPILINYLHGRAFIIVERKRSNSTRKLIDEYFDKGFVCLN